MNPCSNRDVTYSAGPLLAIQMIDWTQSVDGWRYSNQSGWKMLKGVC